MDPFRLIGFIVVGYLIGTIAAAILLAPVFLTVEIMDRVRRRRNR